MAHAYLARTIVEPPSKPKPKPKPKPQPVRVPPPSDKPPANK